MLSALGFSPSVDVDFELKSFKDHQGIMDYLSSPDYQQDDENKGMCFGFSITESSDDDLDIKLIFSGQFQDQSTQSIPSQLNEVWSEFDINADTSSF